MMTMWRAAVAALSLCASAAMAASAGQVPTPVQLGSLEADTGYGFGFFYSDSRSSSSSGGVVSVPGAPFNWYERIDFTLAEASRIRGHVQADEGSTFGLEYVWLSDGSDVSPSEQLTPDQLLDRIPRWSAAFGQPSFDLGRYNMSLAAGDYSIYVFFKLPAGVQGLSGELSVVAVPEAGTLAQMGLGLAGLAVLVRRRKPQA